jgi:hypothetical protein
MAEHQLPKLTVRVRFPSSAPENYPWSEAPFSRTSQLNGDQLRLGRAAGHSQELPANADGASFQIKIIPGERGDSPQRSDAKVLRSRNAFH